MRPISKREKIIEAAICAVMLATLVLAFRGSGGFADAYSSESGSRVPAILAAAGRSLLIAFATPVAALLFGIPAGWILATRKFSLLWLTFIVLPLAMPASVAVSGWVQLAAPGAASRFRSPIPGFGPEPSGILFGPAGVICILASLFWPVIALHLYPAFRRALNANYDAALLSATPRQAFWKIIFPQCRRELFAGMLLVFLMALSDFSVSSLLLVRTLPTEIHDATMLRKNAEAAWVAAPMLALVTVIALFTLRSEQRDGAAIPACRPAAGKTVCAAIFSILGVTFGFAIPILACFRGAYIGGQPFANSFAAGGDAILVSLRIAAAAAALSLFLVLLRAVCWPQTRVKLLNFTALFFFAIPGSFLAAACLALQILLEKKLDITPGPNLSLSFFVAAYVARFMYVPLRLAEEGIASIDPAILESAANLGQDRFTRAISVELPLIAPYLVSSTGLVLIFCLGEVPLATALAPPGLDPATAWLFKQQHMGYDEAVFALSLLLGATAAGTLLFSGLAVRMLGRFANRFSNGS